jgi:hypothetical protein
MQFQSWLLLPLLSKLNPSLGLLDFTDDLSRNFAKISSPLVALLSKEAEGKWVSPQLQAFKNLKQALVEAGGLYLPVPGRKFRIYTDFSSEAVSAILHQE